MKIALIGYGKMGKIIEEIALERGHEIVLKLSIDNPQDFTAHNLKKADIAIEFTAPGAVVDNINKCLDWGVPVVIGTTGWYKQLDEIKNKCTATNGALLYASNFSVGVNLFFQLNKYLAKLMSKQEQYEVSMEEIHHVHKLDSPSGTGITLAEGILENYPRKKSWAEGESTQQEVLGIHSKREGEVPGTHTILYSSKVDDLQISHIAHNRKGFARGAVMAAEWLLGKKGIYTMSDVLNLNSINDFNKNQ